MTHASSIVSHLRSVALNVPDLAVAEAFFTEVWHLDVVAQGPDGTYLRGTGTDHHLISLHAHTGQASVRHVSLRVHSAQALEKASQVALKSGGRVLGPVAALSDPAGGMGLSVVDFMTGMTTAMSLLAGVWGAQRHNRGCDIDISLFDVALAQLNYPAAWFLNEGHTIERMPRSAHPSTVPCELVPCADGWLFVMCMTPKFWRALAEGVGKPASRQRCNSA